MLNRKVMKRKDRITIGHHFIIVIVRDSKEGGVVLGPVCIIRIQWTMDGKEIR